MAFTVTMPNLSPPPGTVRTSSTNYVSGSGTAGSDNSAATVKSVTLAAGVLSAAGDRVHIRALWAGSTGNPMTATLKLNSVTIASTTDAGATGLFLTEAWVEYVDGTHGNVISVTHGTDGGGTYFDDGLLNTSNTAVNVASLAWASAQTIAVVQDAQIDNHIIVYSLTADIYPLGTV